MLKPSTFRKLHCVGRRSLCAYSSFAKTASEVHIQKVRLKTPFFSARRAKIALLYTATFYLWWNYALPLLEGDEEGEDEEDIRDSRKQNKPKTKDAKRLVKATKAAVEDEKLSEDGVGVEVEEEQDEDDADDDDDDDDALFIPLGWARQMPRTFYKGTDPEWQEFRKYSGNSKRREEVKNELAGLVGQLVFDHPSLMRQLGKDVKIRRCWLDIDFPYGPPPEYERSGLIITDDYIAWGAKTVTHQNYLRLQQALSPWPLVTSFYATCKAMFSLQVQRARQLLGISPRPGHDSFMQSVEELQQKRQKLLGLQRALQDKTGQQASTGIPPDSSTTGVKAPQSDVASKDTISPGITGTAGQSTDVSRIFHIFAATLGRSWKPVAGPAPRGTFVVSGLVEVSGSRAACVLDVGAAYDPKVGKYIMVKMRIRRFQLRTQSPRGGQ